MVWHTSAMGRTELASGVRGAAAFCAWNWVQVSHCQTASSMALFTSGQKTHPCMQTTGLWWFLDGTSGVAVVSSPCSDGGTMRASPYRMRSVFNGQGLISVASLSM